MIGAQRSFIATNQKAGGKTEKALVRQSRTELETDGSERLEEMSPE
jgi:hypothetical protein